MPPAINSMAGRLKSPLSFAQQRLWFLDQLSPGSSAYNIPEGYRLSGRLDGKALEAALGEIMRRHETLRSVFVYEQENPVQIIRPEEYQGTLKLSVDDLNGLPDSEQEEEMKRLAQEAFEPFDLTSGPLMRARLLKLGEEEHVLLMTIHHIISDGWSMGVSHASFRHFTRLTRKARRIRFHRFRFSTPTLRFGSGNGFRARVSSASSIMEASA